MQVFIRYFRGKNEKIKKNTKEDTIIPLKHRISYNVPQQTKQLSYANKICKK